MWTAVYSGPAQITPGESITLTLNVKELPLSRRNSRSISPLALFAGVPPVDTIVAEPTCRTIAVRLFWACVELPRTLLMVVSLSYRIELALGTLVKLSASAAPFRVPSYAFPTIPLSFLIPKYTLVYAPRFTPVQVTTAPPVNAALPEVTEQLPPAGSV